MSEGHSPTTTIAMFGWGDRFEDYHDRIGVSLETFRDELTGGWLFNYVEALAGARVQTVLFFFSARVDTITRFRHVATGVPVCVFPTPRAHRKLRNARLRYRPESRALTTLATWVATPLRALATELRRESCAALLCQEYEFGRFDALVGLGRAMRLPVFATYQGADSRVSAIETPVRHVTMRSARGLVIASAEEAERVRSTYGVAPSKIARIPNPVDVMRWRPADRAEARRRLGLPTSATIVEWHGNVQMHRKGLDVLLDAWYALCARRPKDALLLLLVGSGRDSEQLRHRIAGHPQVRWLDRYLHDRSFLWDHLSAADIYALPSRHEGFAVAAVEAMACGLPVVASDVSGVREIVGEGHSAGGIVVPPEDCEALADSLGLLVADLGLARRLGANARRRAEETFSFEVVGEELKDFLLGRGEEAVGQ